MTASRCISPRQAAVLGFITAYFERNGYTPTYGEIAKGLGLKSQSGIHEHVKALERNGRITTEHNVQRSIKIVRTAERFRERLNATVGAMAREVVSDAAAVAFVEAAMTVLQQEGVC